MSVQPLRPDFVIRHTDPAGQRKWVIGEVKLGEKRRVGDSARAALSDLLAYRRDFRAQLRTQTDAYGLGVAWGAELHPKSGDEVVLCTPDTLGEAVSMLFSR